MTLKFKSITLMYSAEHAKQNLEEMRARAELSEHVGEPGQRLIVITKLLWVRKHPDPDYKSANDGIEFITPEGHVLRWCCDQDRMHAYGLWTAGDWYTLDVTVRNHSPATVEHAGVVHVIKRTYTTVQLHGFKHRPVFMGPSSEVY